MTRHKKESTIYRGGIYSHGKMALAKEVSVGEFDACTGLTYVTLQRGRLMFNMGPQRAPMSTPMETVQDTEATTQHHPVDAAADETEAPQAAPPPSTRPPARQQRVFRSGVFTGRSLYAEEAVYLVQRGALVVFGMEEVGVPTISGVQDDHVALADPSADTRQPLPLAQLLALVVRHGFVTLAMLDVYTFLKDHKLHPRRRATDTDDESLEDASMLDVFKSVTETQYVAVEKQGTMVDTATMDGDHEVVMRKRKIKRLTLIFRVVVGSFGDGMPRPRELRRLMAMSLTAENEQASVPLKLAVADADRSVLLFEVA